MSRLQDRICLVTGASNGIGEYTARALAGEGARLILAARREDRLQTLAAELASSHQTSCHILVLDVRNQPDVEKAIHGLPAEWSGIDLLVNNAGLSRGLDKLHEGSLQDWEEMIDTNVKGLLYVSRVVIPGMVERNQGHVINIGSIAGREVYPGGNVYCATKYAVRALTEGMRIDLVGTPIRVSTVDPGMVETEFSLVRFHGDSGRAGKVYKGLTPLSPKDVADAVVYCAACPPHVNVAELLLLPTDQASAAIAHRRS